MSRTQSAPNMLGNKETEGAFAATVAQPRLDFWIAKVYELLLTENYTSTSFERTRLGLQFAAVVRAKLENKQRVWDNGIPQ